MNYTVGRAARRDIDSIAAFYAGERRALGARFVEEVSRSLQLLQEYPRLGRRVGENYRKFPLHGFPFFINYRIDDTNDLIRVIAVSDQRRRPGYWVGRVEEPRPIYGDLKKVPGLFIPAPSHSLKAHPSTDAAAPEFHGWSLRARRCPDQSPGRTPQHGSTSRGACFPARLIWSE